MANLSSLLNWPRNVSPQDRLAAAERTVEMFGGIAGSTTNFPLRGLKPLLEKNLIAGPSRTPKAPILVDYDKFGNLYVVDGTHRYYEALGKGAKDIMGYFAPRTGKSLSLKQMIELAPEYNRNLFEMGPFK